MSDQRTHRWGSGRLISTSVIDFWQISRTVQDPSIPNLPLETPAAAPGGTEIAAFFRPSALVRRGITRERVRHERLFVAEESAAPTASYHAGSGDAFTTRLARSRKRIPLPFMASYTAATPPAVFPVAALGAPAVRRRRDTTNRRAIEVGDITSALVAPLIGSLPEPRAKVVWFERTIRLPQPLAIYPPPTGPPAETVFPPPQAKRRHDGPRKQQALHLAEFTATPPATSPVTIAALAAKKVHRRRQRHGLLLSGGAGIFDSPAVTYEVTPAALHQQGHFKRRDTERRLQSVTPLAEYTVATSTPSDAKVSGGAFSTRKQRGRKRITPPSMASFEAAPPVTAPVVALPLPKANRRKPRRGVLLTGGDGVFQPPYIVLPAPKENRIEQRRKLVVLQVPAHYTAAAAVTYPVTALPPPKVRKVHGPGRMRQVLVPWLEIPVAPPTTDESCFIPPFRRRRR